MTMPNSQAAAKAAFERSLAFVLRWEGGWSAHPQDPGGATMMGVTLATYRRWCAQRGRPAPGPAELRAITAEEVAAIYSEGYWSACRCGELPPPLALPVFDHAVNAGPARAARLLQAALGVAVDGVIGPRTLAAAERLGREPATLVEISAQRGRYYGGLPGFATFGLGWLRRCCDAQREALELLATG